MSVIGIGGWIQSERQFSKQFFKTSHELSTLLSAHGASEEKCIGPARKVLNDQSQ